MSADNSTPPFFSIVVPAYNVENYIGKTLESIKNQEFTDFEAIIVDDGSTDETYLKIQDMVASDDRFTLIRQLNKGLSGARNAGIDRIRGRFVLFIDGDDYIHQALLSRAHKMIIDNPDIQSLLFDYASIDEEGNEFFVNYGHGKLYGKSDIIDSKEALLEMVRGGIPVTAWSYITNSDVFTQSYIRFLEGVKFEDTDTTPIVLMKNSVIKSLGTEPLYFQVQRQDSITKNLRDSDWEDGVAVRWSLMNKTKDFPKYRQLILDWITSQTVTDATSNFLFSKSARSNLPLEVKKLVKQGGRLATVKGWLKLQVAKRKVLLNLLYRLKENK
ncbi:glycosyltransferase family 2 protein [Weissella confusa]